MFYNYFKLLKDFAVCFFFFGRLIIGYIDHFGLNKLIKPIALMGLKLYIIGIYLLLLLTSKILIIVRKL